MRMCISVFDTTTIDEAMLPSGLDRRRGLEAQDLESRSSKRQSEATRIALCAMAASHRRFVDGIPTVLSDYTACDRSRLMSSWSYHAHTFDSFTRQRSGGPMRVGV